MARFLPAMLLVVVAACVLDLSVEAHDQQVIALEMDTREELLQTGTKPAPAPESTKGAKGPRNKVAEVLKRPAVEKPAVSTSSKEEPKVKQATHDALAKAGAKRAKDYVAAHSKDAAEELKQKTADKSSRERLRKKQQPEGQIKPVADAAEASANQAQKQKAAKAAQQKLKQKKAEEQAAKKAEKEAVAEKARKAAAKQKIDAAKDPKHNEAQNKASLAHLNGKQEKIEEKEAKMRAKKANKKESPPPAPKAKKEPKQPKEISLTPEQLAARAELTKAKKLLNSASPFPAPSPPDAKPADTVPDAKKVVAEQTGKEVAEATKEAAAQNKHIVELRQTIHQFQKRVAKTLVDTEQKIKHNTAAIRSEHDALKSDSKTLAKIENLSHQAKKIQSQMESPKAVLIQLAETKETKEALKADLAKKKADLVSNLDKLQAEVREKTLQNAEMLKDKEKAAADKASKAAMTAEQAKVESKRDEFIKAEIEKARAAANLKIVNPLEQKLKDAKAEMDSQKQLRDADRARALTYLKRAQGEAVANSGDDSKVNTEQLSKDDAEADKSSALLRYSSTQAAEAESKYEAIKVEYDALQAKLEAENKKHMDEAAEKAEDEAGPAFDKAAAADEKRVAEEAANKAEQAVRLQIGGETCDKCLKTCKTEECRSWCNQGKWCAGQSTGTDQAKAAVNAAAQAATQVAQTSTKKP